jgi:nicotinamidase-related amidase
MPGGALAVPHGDDVVPVINRLAARFDNVVATQDWHPREQVLWPRAGVRRTSSKELREEAT